MQSIMEDGLADPLDSPTVIKLHNLEVFPERQEARVDGVTVRLTPSETRLLMFLLSNLGVVLSRLEILDRIYGGHLSCTARAVDMQIHGLRKKLGSAAIALETIRGVGYRLFDPGADGGRPPGPAYPQNE